jgi:hypothetical protein
MYASPAQNLRDRFHKGFHLLSKEEIIELTLNKFLSDNSNGDLQAMYIYIEWQSVVIFYTYPKVTLQPLGSRSKDVDACNAKEIGHWS